MAEAFKFELLEEDFNEYLRGGRWDADADDNIKGESVSGDFIKALVLAYNREPTSIRAQQGLGLLALLLGTAEWGVAGAGLPDDPAKKNWESDTGEDSGKHVMSYAVGGVGILHADVGDLEEYVKWVAASDLVPADQKPALQHLTEIKYAKDGILYDQVRAAGRCSGPPGDIDLRGERFRHWPGPDGREYCRKYAHMALVKNDWLVFRTWMRAALRTKEGQRYLLAMWFHKYWQPTLNQVAEGAAEEMLVNARIRNSSPKVATEAIKRRLPLPGVAGRVQRQIDAYAHWSPKTARRRWRIMMRPVVLYRHFSGLPQLIGITCE